MCAGLLIATSIACVLLRCCSSLIAFSQSRVEEEKDVLKHISDLHAQILMLVRSVQLGIGDKLAMSTKGVKVATIAFSH